MSRFEEGVKSPDPLKTGGSKKAETPDSAVAGGLTLDATPAAKPRLGRGANVEGQQTEEEEEEEEDEDLKAPVELMIEFLRAVMDRDVLLASRLCQMILLYEPDNPEVSGFLAIKKSLEDREAEESSGEDEDEDDDSGSDGESSQSSSSPSSSSSSSSSSDDDDVEEEKRGIRPRPCLFSHICP